MQIKMIFIYLLSVSVYAQSPDFFRERIEIAVIDSICFVQGAYYFKNTSKNDISKMLYYPFKVNQQILFPDTLYITERNKIERLKYSKSSDGISFLLNVPAKSIVVIDIVFSQKTTKQIFEYILLTTKKWSKALDFAEYKISVPYNLKLLNISYPFEKKGYDGGNIIYFMERKNFEPDKNIIIQWEG